MKTIILQIDGDYASALSVTAIGAKSGVTNVTSLIINLINDESDSQCKHIKYKILPDCESAHMIEFTDKERYEAFRSSGVSYDGKCSACGCFCMSGDNYCSMCGISLIEENKHD